MLGQAPPLEVRVDAIEMRVEIRVGVRDYISFEVDQLAFQQVEIVCHNGLQAFLAIIHTTTQPGNITPGLTRRPTYRT